MEIRKTNPEIEQDRVEDLVDTFRKYGVVMFSQQERIYKNLARHLSDYGPYTILEAGCGNGVGSAIISKALCSPSRFTATDVREENVQFARCLYPWIRFDTWDIKQPWKGDKVDIVICIEAIEHVTNPLKAIENLISTARKEVWISTPNGIGKTRPPENPFHVCEYTPAEMLEMLDASRAKHVEILNWENFIPVEIDTLVNPLVYRILVQS